MAKAIQISIQLEVYQHIDELPETERYLLNRARQAASRAYAPYSNFLVGAALLTSEGKVVEGNNQENAAYPSGLCAERTALFAAGAMHPELQISMIAVSAKRRGDMYYTAANPCGACRQVIAEYQDRQHTPIRIIMEGNGEIVIANGIDSLLPFRFGQKNLLNS
ncbi:MAG: cytidine deaminase [Cytophagales bacterium]|nr:cytidine deaminase [Bernardetiaceae bacterium]MDW8205492.1 cytidine deaminase [Cytophagales bacterium]